MFDTAGMTALSPDVTAALSTLRSKWGAAAPARAGETIGALATVPEPWPDDEDQPDRSPVDPARIFSTGFAAVDAILGPGGLPRGTGLALRGDLSSGRTTLALRLVAEAQRSGAIVAWLDLAEAIDPLELVARGVQLEWLVVLTPRDLDEGIAIAGSLLAARTVDLLVVDLPPRPRGQGRGRGPGVADRLGRLAALARRAGITLVVLEPPDLRKDLAGAVAEATGVRLELARRSWVRLGRDVVGQRTEVMVARNRAGPPGRRTTIRILYADGGERDACLRREGLLAEGPTLIRWPAEVVPAQGAGEEVRRAYTEVREPPPAAGNTAKGPDRLANQAPVIAPSARDHDATPSSLSTPPPPRPGPAAPALRVVAGGAGRPRREALDGRNRPGRRSGGAGARRPARDGARVGAPSRA
jgi:recombination protein RecA